MLDSVIAGPALSLPKGPAPALGEGSGQPWRWAPLALVAVCLLFLPFFWPLIDHHAAERHPNHVHIYLGTQVAGHTHPYQEPHTHEPLSTRGDSKEGASLVRGDNRGVGDIIYLTPLEEANQALVTLIVNTLHSTAIFPDLGDHWSFPGAPDNDRVLSEAFIALPKKPPRM